jgi:hypothetical protein
LNNEKLLGQTAPTDKAHLNLNNFKEFVSIISTPPTSIDKRARQNEMDCFFEVHHTRTDKAQI